LAFAKTPDPSGLPAAAHARGSDSPGDPLMGFGPPTRYFPNSPTEVSRPAATSLGVSCPFSARGGGSPRPNQLPGRAPRFSGVPPAGPTLPATVSLTGFLNLPATSFLPPPACHVSDRWRSWGSPFRGFASHEDPASSSPPACPLDISPAGCASPVLVGGASGRATGCLGYRQGRAFCCLQGFCPRENRSASPSHV
jgi:hypothetical protein